MSETLALAAVVGIGLYYFSRSSKSNHTEEKDSKDSLSASKQDQKQPEQFVDYQPILTDDPNGGNTPISYSRVAIGEKLIEQKFDIGVSNSKWVFMRAPLTGAQAQVGNVAAAITQYRNGQFYWNATGKAVDWNGYEDRKRIIELLRYG